MKESLTFSIYCTSVISCYDKVIMILLRRLINLVLFSGFLAVVLFAISVFIPFYPCTRYGANSVSSGINGAEVLITYKSTCILNEVIGLSFDNTSASGRVYQTSFVQGILFLVAVAFIVAFVLTFLRYLSKTAFVKHGKVKTKKGS